MKKAGELEKNKRLELVPRATYIHSLRTVWHGSNSTWYFHCFYVRVRYLQPTEIKMVTVFTRVIQTNKEDLELH